MLIHVEPVQVGVGRKIINSGEIVEKKAEMWVIKIKSVGGPCFFKVIFCGKKEKESEGGTLSPKMCYAFEF